MNRNEHSLSIVCRISPHFDLRACGFVICHSMNSAGKAFEQWDERYRAEEYFYGTEPNDFLKSQVDRLLPGASVLCLAEGEGRNAVFLAKQGFSVTAVDGSAQGFVKLQKLAAQAGVNVRTVVKDLAHFDMGQRQWDAIVSIWCHLPQPLRAEIHRRVVVALKPGGFFILEAYTPRQLQFKTGGPPNATMLMTRDLLRTELAGLEIQIAQEVQREIHEGKGHNGKSAVVQFVARKPRL
jgi:SAM-dependent methyltransferase